MSEYNEQRAAFDKAVKTFDGNDSFAAARALLLSGEKTVSFNRKIIEKNIDSSWLTEIEKALPHLDTVIRNPRNTIKEVEEIVPIAMSRKITVESIKHLGQHPVMKERNLRDSSITVHAFLWSTSVLICK